MTQLFEDRRDAKQLADQVSRESGIPHIVKPAVPRWYEYRRIVWTVVALESDRRAA